MGPGASHPRHDDLTALAGLAEQDLPVRALYVVALPIGNAADITLRALWTLARVDAIAAEDTRVTGPLLARFGIATPLLAAHQHNERAVAAAIVDRLQQGQRVALVSDAGTPGVSDPGAVIVRAVLEADLRVIPIPGASSALAAVSAVGLRVTAFRFIGFLPAGARERERLLRDIALSDGAAVLFEAPHRIRALQGDLSHILTPDRRVVIARELTKKFETIRVHTASALADLEPEERGEYVIVIDAAEQEARPALDPQGQRWLDALLEEMTPARAAAVVSRMTGVPRSTVYDEAIGRRRKAPPE
ncbi:MAG TPA: 16S rRNA (cytidine(1402)-2'-O)-methyltransferase [Burkholderiaceae bacterium]|nr:16S rRNA (cytidine(1402)-2'-O)-methyltransferase [Burkholderiaceae bacterium]